MAEGMKRAVLDTLRTRSWSVRGEVLSGDDVAWLYEDLAAGRRPRMMRGTRRWDRAISILKKHRLVRFDRSSDSWTTNTGGEGG